MSLDLLKPCELNAVMSRVEMLPTFSAPSIDILNKVGSGSVFKTHFLTTRNAIQNGIELKKSYDAMKTLEQSIAEAKDHATRDQRIVCLKIAFQGSCLVSCVVTAAILGISTVGSMELIAFWACFYLFSSNRFLKQCGDACPSFGYAILTGKNFTLPFKLVFERVANLEQSVEPQKKELLKRLTQYQEKFQESMFYETDFYRNKILLLLSRLTAVTTEDPQQLESLENARKELRAIYSFYHQIHTQYPSVF